MWTCDRAGVWARKKGMWYGHITTLRDVTQMAGSFISLLSSWQMKLGGRGVEGSFGPLISGRMVASAQCCLLYLQKMEYTAIQPRTADTVMWLLIKASAQRVHLNKVSGRRLGYRPPLVTSVAHQSPPVFALNHQPDAVFSVSLLPVLDLIQI